jgi:hypothetical protein
MVMKWNITIVISLNSACRQVGTIELCVSCVVEEWWNGKKQTSRGVNMPYGSRHAFM